MSDSLFDLLDDPLSAPTPEPSTFSDRQLPHGGFREAIEHRVESVMDLVEAWQKRKEPKA